MSDLGFPLQISDVTEQRYGTCTVCGRTARWWPPEAWAAARWVHVIGGSVRFVDYPEHSAEVAS